MQNLGRAFIYPFEDERWIGKIALGGLFVLLWPILIGIPFVLGYMLDVVRNVAAGEERPLPEWQDMRGFFARGLVLAVVLLVYSIPGWVLSSLAEAAGPNGGAGLGCLSALYSLALGILLPAVILRVATTRDIAAAFELGPIFDFIQRNLSSYVVVVLLTFVAWFLAPMGIVVFCVGVLFTTFYAVLVEAYLLGALARATAERPGPSF